MLNAPDDRFLFVQGSQHDDRQIGELLNGLAELKAVHAGHVNVDDSQVRKSAPSNGVQALFARGGDEYLKASVHKLVADQAQNMWVVVYYKNALSLQ